MRGSDVVPISRRVAMRRRALIKHSMRERVERKAAERCTLRVHFVGFSGAASQSRRSFPNVVAVVPSKSRLLLARRFTAALDGRCRWR